MSTDLIALFDAPSPEINLKWLLEKFIASPQFAADIIDRYGDKWLVKGWEIQKSEGTGAALFGPGGFVLRMKSRTLEMYHMIRFAAFSGDEAFRSELRNACYNIARLVGSKRAIYTHELMPYEGEDLFQIEESLRAGIGPPAASFQELESSEYFAPRAWYIDHFEDLKRR